MTTHQEALDLMMKLDGAIALAVVDHTSGMVVNSQTARPFDIELASALYTEVVRSELRTLRQFGAGQHVDDILITLSDQLHLILVGDDPKFAGLFLFFVLDREHGNLALARRRLQELSDGVEL